MKVILQRTEIAEESALPAGKGEKRLISSFDIREEKNKRVFPRMLHEVWRFFSTPLLAFLAYIEGYTRGDAYSRYEMLARCALLLCGLFISMHLCAEVFSVPRGEKRLKQAVWTPSPFFFVCICLSLFLSTLVGLILFNMHMGRIVQLHAETVGTRLHRTLWPVWDALVERMGYRFYAGADLFSLLLHIFMGLPGFRNRLFYSLLLLLLLLQLCLSQSLAAWLFREFAADKGEQDAGGAGDSLKRSALYLVSMYREVA